MGAGFRALGLGFRAQAFVMSELNEVGTVYCRTLGAIQTSNHVGRDMVVSQNKGTCWCEPTGCEVVTSGLYTSLVPSLDMSMAHTVGEAFMRKRTRKKQSLGHILKCYYTTHGA